MRELIQLRSQILSGNLPADEMRETKLLATSVIDTGNKLLGMDMVVRNDEDGNVLDINSTATTQLFERHMNASDRIRRASVSGNYSLASAECRLARMLMWMVTVPLIHWYRLLGNRSGNTLNGDCFYMIIESNDRSSDKRRQL